MHHSLRNFLMHSDILSPSLVLKPSTFWGRKEVIMAQLIQAHGQNHVHLSDLNNQYLYCGYMGICGCMCIYIYMHIKWIENIFKVLTGITGYQTSQCFHLTLKSIYLKTRAITSWVGPLPCLRLIRIPSSLSHMVLRAY